MQKKKVIKRLKIRVKKLNSNTLLNFSDLENKKRKETKKMKNNKTIKKKKMKKIMKKKVIKIAKMTKRKKTVNSVLSQEEKNSISIPKLLPPLFQEEVFWPNMDMMNTLLKTILTTPYILKIILF